MDDLSARAYDSESTQKIRSAAARHGGDSIAANARWREAVDGLPPPRRSRARTLTS